MTSTGTGRIAPARSSGATSTARGSVWRLASSRRVIGKVLGGNGGGSDTIMQAIQWAVQNGANVISMSLGIDFPGFVKQLEGQGLPTETGDVDRARRLPHQRAAVRAARVTRPGGWRVHAGHGARRRGGQRESAGRRSRTSRFRSARLPWPPGIVSVAALDTGAGGFTIAPFSNVGAQVSGPGVGVISAKRGGGLTAMSGTSMATPHVAGVATLWAQKLKIANQLNAGLLAARVVGSATTTGLKAGFDPSDIGAGIVQAPQA